MPSLILRSLFPPGWLAALCIFSGQALAHDLWVEREGRLHTLLFGHQHSGHAGTGRLEYPPGQVKRMACFNGAGRETPAEPGMTYPVTLRGECAATWFLTSSGYWSKTPYGTRNVPRTEAGGAVLASWLSVESVKRLDAWGETLARPLTRELEIVPLSDPLGLKAGDKLRLAVYRDGRPAEGVTVAYFGHPRGVTGADGQVNVRIREPGYQLIQASLDLPLADGKADKAVHATALVFEVPR